MYGYNCKQREIYSKYKWDWVESVFCNLVLVYS
jgi:hypothetical protein